MARVLFVTDEYRIEPLGVGYLAAALHDAEHEVGLVQVPANRYGVYDTPRIADRVRDWNPDLLAYSVTTGQHRLWREAHGRLRLLLQRDGLNPLAVFGGPHPTYFPQFLDSTGIEIICRGEGEKALLRLANAVGDGWRGKKHLQIPGLVMRMDSMSQDGGVAPLPDVTKLGWPDRELLYAQSERNRTNPIRDVIASRGCPFKCPYCYNDSYRRIVKTPGNVRRLRQPEEVVAECADVVQHWPTKMFYFQDDLFTVPKAWFRRVASLYASRVRLPYHCHVRPELLTKDDVQVLKDTGCHGVTTAIESGNAELREKALGRKMSDEQILESCAWIREAGLRLRTENMIGIPGETLATAWETVRLNARCKPDVPWASLYQPYPGTALGTLAEQEGLCLVDPETVRPSFFEDLPLELPDRERLVNMQKFFSVMVRHSTLRPVGRLLTRLPPNRRFQAFSDWYRRRGYQKRLYRL